MYDFYERTEEMRASVLRDAGYRTGAFIGAFVLDARFGLARGFDVYDDRVGSDTGPVTFAGSANTMHGATEMTVYEAQKNAKYQMVSPGLQSGF